MERSRYTNKMTADHDAWLGAVRRIDVSPQTDFDAFLAQASAAAVLLPADVIAALRTFRKCSGDDGVFLLRGLPLDPDLPSTPNLDSTVEPASKKATHVSEACIALVASQLGDIFGYAQMHDGALIQNVVPVRAEADEQSSAGSRVELVFHTEQHFHPYSPHYVLLCCLRSHPDAATTFAGVRQIISLLDDATRELLYQPRFRTGLDYAFGPKNAEPGNGPALPILYGDRDDPCLCFDDELMIGGSPDADAAIAAVRDAARRAYRSVTLEPGDLLVLDNRRCIHGRAAFTPRFDGQDRWLQRAKVIHDLAAIDDRVPGTRLIHTAFT